MGFAISGDGGWWGLRLLGVILLGFRSFLATCKKTIKYFDDDIELLFCQRLHAVQKLRRQFFGDLPFFAPFSLCEQDCNTSIVWNNRDAQLFNFMIPSSTPPFLFA